MDLLKMSGDRVVSEPLLGPYNYICQMPGKHIRTKLAKAFNHWLKVPEEKVEEVSEIVQMLHNASLMIDDIEDNSILRRGLPVAHSIYGVPLTINAANYVYFLALEKTLQLGHPNATAVYTEQMLELHRGQGKEIYWRDTVMCPSEEEYLKMVEQKTGGLFCLAVGLMQLFSLQCQDTDFRPLIRHLGMYFQVRDDYANLRSSQYAEQKSYAEDLTEGKFSFPVIHAITTEGNGGGQVLNIVRQRPKDFDVKKYCVSLLEKAGSFQYTENRLSELESQIEKDIDCYGGNPLLKELIKELQKGLKK